MGIGHIRAALLAASILECFGCGGVTSDRLDTSEKRRDAAADESCKIGEERCACARGNTCHTGLSCASGLCVKLPGSAQPSDAATASGGASGTVTDGAVSEGGGPADAETDAGPARGAGGSHAGAGGRATGGRAGGSAMAGHPATGGAGGDTGGASASGGSPEDAGACPIGQKLCGGLCTPPAPRVGCGLTGCDPCSLTAPVNGYVTCAGGQCVFDCLSGYQKNGNQCERSGAGGSGGTGNCVVTACPNNCGPVLGPACCTMSGKCGCPNIPYVAATCI